MDNEPKVLKLTERELTEIKHSLFYAMECNHGTTGHNQLLIVAKLAVHLGFALEMTDGVPAFVVSVPDGVEVVSK